MASHAEANRKEDELSFLEFQGTTGQNSDSLFVGEIYHLPIEAELVTLSACETGIGRLARNEGQLSLSRAFLRAGARSVVSTLWPVEDEKTYQLIMNFYGSLKGGMRKDEALRAARLTLLERAREQQEAHPFFWAAFVGVGDMRPLY